MSLGLNPTEIKVILDITKKYNSVEKVILFGSRAMGNNKPGSDVDIAIIGQCSEQELSQIKYKLEEETMLPYFFDIILFNSIDNSKLKEHIKNFGVELK